MHSIRYRNQIGIASRIGTEDNLITITKLLLAEITQSAIRLLCQEIGFGNTARFLNQFSTGYGNHTEDRNDLFGDIPVEEVVAEIRRKRCLMQLSRISKSIIFAQSRAFKH